LQCISYVTGGPRRTEGEPPIKPQTNGWSKVLPRQGEKRKMRAERE